MATDSCHAAEHAHVKAPSRSHCLGVCANAFREPMPSQSKARHFMNGLHTLCPCQSFHTLFGIFHPMFPASQLQGKQLQRPTKTLPTSPTSKPGNHWAATHPSSVRTLQKHQLPDSHRNGAAGLLPAGTLEAVAAAKGESLLKAKRRSCGALRVSAWNASLSHARRNQQPGGRAEAEEGAIHLRSRLHDGSTRDRADEVPPEEA